MYRCSWTFLSLLLCTATALPAQMQQAAGAARSAEPGASARQAGGSTLWVGAGVGVGTSESTSDDFGVSANLSYRSDAHLLSLRGVAVGELFGDDFWDIGLLYGRATGDGPFFASLGLGIAAMGGTRNSGGIFDDDPGEEISTRVSLPLELQLSWRPLRFLGIAVYGFANVNDEESFGGATLGVQIGRLREE